MVALGNINEWQPPHGPLTMWTALPTAHEAARTARRGDLAPSYQQAQHLWSAYHGKAMDRQLPRLMVVAWDIAGECDIAAMTAAINAHVRRHDTYHSWFEFENGVIVRRAIDDPDAIDLMPVSWGQMTPDQVRTHVLTTPRETHEWGCFTFGIVEHTDYFTFYASVDHLHIDGLSAGIIFFDIHLTYQELTQGATHQSGTPAQLRSYCDYTARQREKVGALTLSSPEIKGWIDYARDTDGNWPSFPLPLGNTWSSTAGDLVTVELLDAAQTEAFDATCVTAGARFLGGVLACTALAAHELTGNEIHHGFTARDTRTPGIDTMTVGWFASMVPVTVPTAGVSFPEAARAAQKSFDAAKDLGHVPVQRVLELATPDELGIKLPTQLPMMLSFLDFRKIPLNGLWAETKFGTYGDSLSAGGVNVWINRHAERTTVTISFPDNEIARESVRQYIETLNRIFARVVGKTREASITVGTMVNSDGLYVVAPTEDDNEAA
ncbi:condensation domain-containing protein [Mycobacterium montefiorense]|uniref:Conserved polyketide synthase associated protein PapA2 n=1 Tax=Mycobacterium montefiorense TaxID=154654 RepID=A0AA37PLQ9_9MYCO|nr:putative conserved polyketide synthase associated protein PapA2 [Mycobacterium montefiorense]GKU33636.1 putative conserved polyketide synthase associated protein PapA2 [Mycobacterium montefiorense]GKU39573.1 putative conserved polyketide synthase associated protein PapA2 [Mycobacterium montefiorense]GKU43850.1 putative conserved polyketide synthase associated protein PapA2 [Mycobacterium montefiorense]GKU52658.1 putative conserved polyketide synthase associated protein PapA2 [Mycobacterium m